MKLFIRLWRSSVGKQAIAGATGMILAAWLVLHVAGNLLVFSGAATTDGYAASLRRIPALLWGVRGVTAAALALHIAAVTALFRQARAARGARDRERSRVATLASRTMRVGGALLLVFLVLHLLHLTFGVLHPRFDAARVYDNVVIGLASPAIAIAYALAAVLVGAHLAHGIWAATRRTGVTRATERRAWLALLVAGLVAIGFASVPIAVLAGVVR